MLNILDLFNTTTTTSVSIEDFLICIASALVMGVLLAFVYTFKNQYTKSFVVTLALLPAIVSLVIMMVSGNLGAGVAVAGTFSLVRFRSVPGTAKEIGAIFLAMATGLAMGMGYIGYAFLFAILVGAINIVYNLTSFGQSKKINSNKTLRITIPEDLDYANVFDDLFDKYTTKRELIAVKTTNMGSLFKLTYNISLKDATQEKAFIDDLRCRNGNLEITSSIQQTTNVTL